MKVKIVDREALLAVSPEALAAYARNLGWHWQETYREYSSVYVSDKLPEILVPNIRELGDYAEAVYELINEFCRVTGRHAMAVYRSLITHDRDVIRVRATGTGDENLGLRDGVNLLEGSRDLLLAAARSLHDSQPFRGPGAAGEVNGLLNEMRLGHVDPRGFAVNLLTPVIPPPVTAPSGDPDQERAPPFRRVTERLMEALEVTRRRLRRMAAGDGDVFLGPSGRGVSENLCEALARMVEPFSTVAFGMTWALTRPATRRGRVVRFTSSDVPPLTESVRRLRCRGPDSVARLRESVGVLGRGEGENDGVSKAFTL